MGIAFKSKQIIAGAIDAVGLPDYVLSRLKPRIILGYHRVLPEVEIDKYKPQDAMYVSVSNFEKQIKWMLKIGTIVSVESIIKRSEVARPVFAITFDDGWIDNYEHAFPILKKYNIPAMIFLSTNAIETNEMFWTEEVFYKTSKQVRSNQGENIVQYITSLDIMRDAERCKDIDGLLDRFVERLKDLDTDEREKQIFNYYERIQVGHEPVQGHILGWNHIREMQQHGITFGSHMHTHMITRGAYRKKISEELVISKNIIEARTGTKCNWFCYPNSYFNKDDHILLREAGYDYGVTLHSARLNEHDSPYYLPRFIMYEDITEVLGYIKLRLLRTPLF